MSKVIYTSIKHSILVNTAPDMSDSLKAEDEKYGTHFLFYTKK